MYKKRFLADRIRRALEFFPVVAVVGARQTGKTTLVREEFPERRYFSLDFPEIRAAAEEDPYGFLASLDPPATIDEIQKVPEIFQALKALVDKKREPGMFLITGSANFLLLSKISETLAGRIAVFELPGFAISEAEGYPPPDFIKRCLQEEKIPHPDEAYPKPYIEALIKRGTLPPSVLAPDQEIRRMWLENYVATYLERDLRDLSQVASLGDFRRVMGLAASRTASILNVSELARDAGISVSTARNYLQLLEISYQIRRLPPYFANLGKRLVKSPKLHFRDTAVALTLSGLGVGEESLFGHPYFAQLVETFLVEEIIKLTNIFIPEAKFYHFRTHGGTEVDLVIEAKGRLLPIEIKSSVSLSPKKTFRVKKISQRVQKQGPLRHSSIPRRKHLKNK